MLKKSLYTALIAALGCGILSYGQDGGNTALHVKKFVAPAYPPLARKNRMQGTTTSVVEVRADGTVASVTVTMAHPFFHVGVAAALRQWTFEPVGVPTSLKVTVKFSLENCDEIPLEALTETRVQADLPDTVEVDTCLAAIETDVD
jgi:TonB family C-terminal domain